MAEENNFTRNRFLLQTFNCNSNSVRIRWAALVWVKNNPFVCSGGSSRGAEGAPTEGARGEHGVRGARGRRLGREVHDRGSAGAWRAVMVAQWGPSGGRVLQLLLLVGPCEAGGQQPSFVLPEAAARLVLGSWWL